MGLGVSPRHDPWCGQTPPYPPCQEGGARGDPSLLQVTRDSTRGSHGISVSASGWLILFLPEVAQNVTFSMVNLMDNPAPGWSCCSFSFSTACHGHHFIPTGISQTKAGMISRPCSEVCVGSGILTVPCRWSCSTKEEIGLQEKAS